MRWSRVDWMLAGLYIVTVVGLNIECWTLDHEEWTSEIGRAVDRAGLYLSYCGPVLLALVGLAAQRTNKLLTGIVEGLPDASLPGRASASRFVALGLAVHCMVVVAFVAGALRAGALNIWDLSPILRQTAWILASASLGAMVGTWFSMPGLSVLVAVLAMVLPNLLGTVVGGASFVTVGTGLFDFAFSTYSDQVRLASVLFLVAATLIVWPRLFAARTRRVGGATAFTAALLGATIVATSPTLLAPVNSTTVCVGDSPTVCGPTALRSSLQSIAGDIAPLTAASQGGNTVPERVLVTAPGDVTPGTQTGRDAVILEWQSTDRNDTDTIRRAYAHAAAGAFACDTGDLAQIIAMSALEAMMLFELGPVPDGTYPKSTVVHLQSMTPAEQEKALQLLYSFVYSCGRNPDAADARALIKDLQ